MKLRALILGLLITAGGSVIAQVDSVECQRYRRLAQKERMANPPNFQLASTYLIMAESLCGQLDSTDFAYLIYSLSNAHSQSDAEAQKLYADTLVTYYGKMEDRGLYEQSNDLIRAYYMMNCSQPDYKGADAYFARGVKNAGDAIDPLYLQLYFYNVYVIHTMAAPDEQEATKMRIIDEYFNLMGVAQRSGMDSTVINGLTSYIDAVVPSYEELLKPINDFLANSEDMELTQLKAAIINFVNLLERKAGTETDEFEKLIKTLIDTGDDSPETALLYARLLLSKGKLTEAIEAFKRVKTLTNDKDIISECDYTIAVITFNRGSYSSAYKMALDVEGKFKGKAYVLAGDAVIRNKENCGLSDFEKSWNYLYAEELYLKADAMGQSVSSKVSTCRANFPSSEEVFREGSPTQGTIACYSVTVKIRTKD